MLGGSLGERCAHLKVVVLLPVSMVALIEGDKLFEERITLAIGARGVLNREQLQLRMQAPHLLHDGKVLRVESLYLYGQCIVIHALTFLKLLVLGGDMMLLHDVFHLCGHLFDLLMRDLLEVELVFLAQFVLDTRCVLFGTTHEVLIHDAVVGELEHHECALLQVPLFRFGVKISLDFRH